MTLNRIFRGKARRGESELARQEPVIATPPSARQSESAEAKKLVRTPRPEPPRRGSEIPRSLRLPTFAARPEASAPPREVSGKGRLVVGPEIRFKGDISSCDTLVVQGLVESSMVARAIEVAENGAFAGEARVEAAEIGGRFDGVLTVRGRLVVRPRGRIDGTVRYGEIEIQPGGRIGGDVQAADEAPAAD